MNDSHSSSSTSILEHRPLNDLNDTHNDIEDFLTKKYRGASKFYDLYKSYDSLKECLDELKNGRVENTNWATKQKRNTYDGEKRFFKCSNCKKQLYLLLHATHLGVSIFLEDLEHDHSVKSNKIPTRTKDKVFQLYFEKGKKPIYICHWLKKNLHDQYVELTTIQVNNLISCKKRKDSQNQQKCQSIAY